MAQAKTGVSLDAELFNAEQPQTRIGRLSPARLLSILDGL